MHLIDTTTHDGEFEPLIASSLGQAAMMSLRPGQASDDEVRNEHPRSEQWLYVVDGTGTATVVPRKGTARRVKLKQGALLVIQRGERHQIKNSGRAVLRAITFYLPPAYDSGGHVLKAAQGRS